MNTSLGECLKRLRTERGLSLESMARRTRIHESYLQGLEDNDLSKLPPASLFVKAYVKAYSRCLALSEKEEAEVLLRAVELTNGDDQRSPVPALKESPDASQAEGGRWIARSPAVIGFSAAAAVFVTDLTVPPGVNGGLLYLIPVLLVLWRLARKDVLWVAAGCTGLGLLASVLHQAGPLHGLAFGDRLLSFAALWVVALLGVRYRSAEDALRQADERLDAHGFELARTNEALRHAIAERTQMETTLRDAQERGRGMKDMTEQQEPEARLPEPAYYDGLTGLPSRRLFMEMLKQAMSRASRLKTCVAVLFLDLDGFKLVNETLGRQYGDQVLKTVAERLAVSIRSSDVRSRWGDDEFTVVLENIAIADDVSRVAQKILDATAQLCTLEGYEVALTGSIGIALFPTDATDADALIQHADTAMSTVKAAGNGFQFYSAKATERLWPGPELRRVLPGRDFVLHDQPIIDAQARGIGERGLRQPTRVSRPRRTWM